RLSGFPSGDLEAPAPAAARASGAGAAPGAAPPVSIESRAAQGSRFLAEPVPQLLAGQSGQLENICRNGVQERDFQIPGQEKITSRRFPMKLLRTAVSVFVVLA